MKVAAIALGALMALAFFLTFASAFYFNISVKDIVFGSGWAYSSVDAKSRVVGALMLIAPLATIVATALAKNGKAAWIVNSVTGGFVFGLTVMTLMSLSKQGGGFVSFGAGAYLYLICSFALLVITFYAYHVASKK